MDLSSTRLTASYQEAQDNEKWPRWVYPIDMASTSRWTRMVLPVLSIVATLMYFAARASSVGRDRPLILYTYHDTPDARTNILFFINHGLHAQADFIFILQGSSDINQYIPDKPNIEIVQRANTCYDMGAYGEVLQRDQGVLMKKYQRYILINASIRGPFIPYWANNLCWSDAFLNKVTRKVKLVGMAYDCHYFEALDRHLQSMIFATDTIGLQLLMAPRCLSSCYNTWQEAVQAEVEATHLIREGGYEVDSMNIAFHGTPDYALTCTNVTPTISYAGGYMHPYETVFIKTKLIDYPQGIGSFLGELSNWQSGSGFSSYDACK